MSLVDFLRNQYGALKSDVAPLFAPPTPPQNYLNNRVSPALQQNLNNQLGDPNQVARQAFFSNPIPQFNSQSTAGRAIQFLPNMAIGAVNQGISPVLSLPSDIYRETAAANQGNTLPYDQLNSPLSRLGYQGSASLFGNQDYSQTPTTLPSVLSNVAQAANPFLLASGVGAGGEALTSGASLGQKILQGSLTGAKYGAGFGALQGFADNPNAALPQQLGAAGRGALYGGAGGAALGAAGPVVGEAAGRLGTSLADSVVRDPVTGKLPAKPGFAQLPGGDLTPAEQKSILKEQLSMANDALNTHPGKDLIKYTNKNGELPQVTGKSSSQFGTSGDVITSNATDHLGGLNSSDAEQILQDYRNLKSHRDEINTQLTKLNSVDRKTLSGKALETPNKDLQLAQSLGLKEVPTTPTDANLPDSAMRQDPSLVYSIPAQNGADTIKPELPSSSKVPEINAYGEAPADVKAAAKAALGDRYAATKMIEARAQATADYLKKGIAPEEQMAFRDAVEHPLEVDKIASKTSDPTGFTKAVESFKQFTQSAYDNYLKAGGDSIGFVKNYFPHVLDLSDPAMAAKYEAFINELKNSKGSFTKERVFDDVRQLLASGFKLKNETVLQDLQDYSRSISNHSGNAALLKSLKQSVPQHVSDTPIRGPQGEPFKQLDVPGLEGTFVSPELHQHLKNVGTESVFADNPYVKFADWANQFLKQAKLAGGGFHAIRETINYVGNELANLRLPNVVQAAKVFFSPEEFSKLRESYIADGTLDKAAQLGVVIGSRGDLGKLGDVGALNLIKEKNPLTLLHQATFDRLINYYKLETVRKLNLDLSTPEGIAIGRQVGAQVNNLFGGLNYDVLNRNKTTQQILRFGGLAPDFNEGKIRTLVTALNPTERGAAGNFARRALVGQVVATALGVEVARRLASGKFDDLRTALQNTVLTPNVPLAYKSPTGKDLVADVPGSTVSDIAKAVKDPGHFLTSHGSALTSLATQAISGKDYFGNPLVDPYAPQNPALQIAQKLGTTVAPIPGYQALQVIKGKENLTTAALNTAGLRVHNDPNNPSNQYFVTRDKLVSKLNPNEQNAFKTIHPDTKDQSGNKIDELSAFNTPVKADLYLKYPNVLAVDTKLALQDPKHNPFFDLSPDQQKLVLQKESMSNPLRSSDVAGLTTEPWYQQYLQNRTDFFASLPGAKPTAPSPTPVGPPAAGAPISANGTPNGLTTASALNPYGTALPGTAVGPAALTSLTPGQLAVNDQRAALGLPPISASGPAGRIAPMSGARIKPTTGKAPRIGGSRTRSLSHGSKGRTLSLPSISKSGSTLKAHMTPLKTPKSLVKAPAMGKIHIQSPSKQFYSLHLMKRSAKRGIKGQ